MNVSRILRTALGTLALCGMAGSALADDYVYKGDCERARMVQQERTVDKLIPYQKYNGVMLLNVGTDSCGRDALHSYQLTMKSRSASKIVFDLKRTNYRINKKYGDCKSPEDWSNGEYGTVEITTGMAQNSGACELYLYSTWTIKATSNPNYKDVFSSRMSTLSNGGLVMSGWLPNGSKFWSPLALTPVQ